MSASIDKLIISTPYLVPSEHWHYDRDTRSFNRKAGRRDAGYVVATKSSKSFDDPGVFVPIELVNQIRIRVDRWRDAGYPGVTGITKRLLEYWLDSETRADKRFFFCQMEAIETLIWLTEAPDAEKTGINIPSDGGDFVRWCSKMATGTGKTVVMSMIISWQVLNKVAYKQDTRYSKNVLMVAPGLTVKSRLQVLDPNSVDNYYEEFNIVPPSMMEQLRQGKVKIVNWHMLAWDDQASLDEKVEKGQLRSVDKRRRMEVSDEVYLKQVLEEMSSASNIIVINDEAHHAWRLPTESKVKGLKKEDLEEATIWINGLDRINNSRGILRCFDLSATPFVPSGKQAAEEALFSWIVSDFGLNDAIESGLVKTPRVVVRDDSKELDQQLKSKLYHIYGDEEVKDDLNRKDETAELPGLLKTAYLLLGKDWLETRKSWEQLGHKVPPVMITVANTTYTASRINKAFLQNDIWVKELCEPDGLLQIDSSILNKADEILESGGSIDDIADVDDSTDLEEDAPFKKLSKKDQALLLRAKVDTVGREGKAGEKLQNIISVGMLSEGWDARTVTHIMGLRAFSSQLLCEQVVGRGLRRVSYDVGEDGLFVPEYVNIFGVPFTFLPHEGGEDGPPPPPPPPKTRIEPIPEKIEHEIAFPNVVRIDIVYKPVLELKFEDIDNLYLDSKDTITEAVLGGIIEGKSSVAALTEIELKSFAEQHRQQTIVFRSAVSILNELGRNDWKGDKNVFLAQLIDIIEQFLMSDKLVIKDTEFVLDPLKKKILLIVNMTRIIKHIWHKVNVHNVEGRELIFDRQRSILSTTNMPTWYTSKKNEAYDKTHVSFIVGDSNWEIIEARILQNSKLVKSFIKNDHLGLVIWYQWQGIPTRYFPDYLIKLNNGKYMILEVKGKDDAKQQEKRKALDLWIRAVNEDKGFGEWCWDVSFDPDDLSGILLNHSK
jgi:type III restriction enzyme